MKPAEDVLFLESAGRRLLGRFHPAAGDADFALLFVHPFGEEKKCAHRALVETARALAPHGVASLRFDLSGCGDSDGDFAHARYDHWLADVVAAASELRRRTPRRPLALLGLRLGAALAARACRRIPDVAALILWQPVINGKTEFASDLRRLLIQQMITEGRSRTRHADILAAFQRGEGHVQLDGYQVSPQLYSDLGNISLASDRHAWPHATGIVQFARRSRAIESFARETDLPALTIDIPPIWIRSDFLATRETGQHLARQSVLPLIEKARRQP